MINGPGEPQETRPLLLSPLSSFGSNGIHPEEDRADSGAESADADGAGVAGISGKVRSTWRYNRLVMGCAFALLFTGYNTTQSFATQVAAEAGRADLGFTSLAIVYAAIPPLVLVAPWVVSRLGVRATMALGSSLYSPFIASWIVLRLGWVWGPAFVLGSAALLGAGASLLWVAQGAFLTLNGPAESRAFNAGVFWLMYSSSGVFGNALAFALTAGGGNSIDAPLFFGILAGFAILGFLTLCATRRVPGRVSAADVGSKDGMLPLPAEVVRVEKNTAAGNSSPLALLKRVARLALDRRILLLTPLFLFSGYELSFWSGVWPLVITDGGKRPDRLIGLGNIALAFGEITTALSVGWISDRLPLSLPRRTMVVVMGSVMYAGALLLVWGVATATHPAWASLEVICVASFLLGATDAALNTAAYAALGDAFAGDEEIAAAAFVYYQLYQNIGSALGFFIAPDLPPVNPSYLQLVILGVGCLVSLLCIAFSKLCDAVKLFLHNH